MSYPYLSDVVYAATGYQLPLPLASFGFFVAVATLVAAGFLRTELQRLYSEGKIPSVRRVMKTDNGRSETTDVPPQAIVTDLCIAVMLAGVAGARIFHILDHMDAFSANPWSMIFSRSGLSIFGGLIFGTLAGLICVKRWKLPVRPLLDAAAPAMMLGYAIGRIGCQVSGDGDWGIAANMALKPDFLPTWLWSQFYEHNIFGEIIPAPGVYPTPIYETGMALLCFLLLWTLRKHPFSSGWLFSVYLLLTGAERFLIEQIRVNPVFDIAGFRMSQAEIIAVFLMISGTAGIALLGRRTVRQLPCPLADAASEC